MRRYTWALLTLALLWVAPAWAKKQESKYKSVEVKHFTRAEGVELPAEFPDLLYAELKKDLQKAGLFEEILSEGEVVDPADAGQSVILEGSVLRYGKGSAAKEAITSMTLGIGIGRRSLAAKVTVRRRSDNEVVFEKEVVVKASSQMSPQLLADALAKKIAGELKGGIGR